MHWIADLEYDLWCYCRRRWGYRWLPWLNKTARQQYIIMRQLLVNAVYEALEETQ